MGGGNHCAIVGCHAGAKHRGPNRLSFHKLPNKGTNDEWRQKLVHRINRCDGSFNPNNAAICSRHFLPTCFQTSSRGVRKLIQGSLPTENMPTRTIETPQLPERKPPKPREPPMEVERIHYINLEDVKKDVPKLPSSWIVLESTESVLSVGTMLSHIVTKNVQVFSDLSTLVKVHGMPVLHLDNTIGTIPLRSYLTELSNLHVCPGITDPELQQFGQIPTIQNVANVNKYFLHATYSFPSSGPCCTTCVRSKTCHLLSKQVVCVKCTDTRKLLVLKQKRLEKSNMQSLKPNDPLYATSNMKLKLSIKIIRQKEKKQRQELNRFKQQLSKKSVTLNRDQQDGLQTVMNKNKVTKPLAKLFWKEQCKAFQVKDNRGMKWHPMMIRLALLLHSKSKAAYHLLRDTGVLKLPGETSLRDYTNYIHPRTGFQPNVLDEIRAAAQKLGEDQRYVVLLHDEMTIKEDLVFDNRSQELVGFVNLNNWEEDANCSTLATHVLVFFVVGLNSTLKISMGFFATKTASADAICPLFWQAIGILEQTCGLKVIASTSDKASPNQRLYQIHGQQGEICYKSENVFAPDRCIYFFSDVPHLMKTVRNNLFRSGYGKTMLLWNNGKYLLWQHICDLFRKDREQALWRLPKLTNEHINLSRHAMMSVRYATQVLSETVGKVMKEHGGDDATETAEFILLMNTFFDCLNCRSLTEGLEKRNENLLPYTDRLDPRYQFLDNFLAYVEQWRMTVQTREGNWSAAEKAKMFLTHQTYKGLVMTIKSFREASMYLLDHGVQFVLSNKFCQDPLEQHFGRHMTINSRSENPNLYRFGYQENKIRQQRTLALTIQPKGNIEKRKRDDTEITITNSPLKKARKEQH